jgi:hypothetical protein
MRIHQIEPILSVNKFKNKEDFCNKLIQKVISLTKNNPIYLKSNKKILELDKLKNSLTNKNNKLDSLLEKSKIMKEDLTNKVNVLVEENNMYKDKLLNVLKN